MGSPKTASYNNIIFDDAKVVVLRSFGIADPITRIPKQAKVSWSSIWTLCCRSALCQCLIRGAVEQESYSDSISFRKVIMVYLGKSEND